MADKNDDEGLKQDNSNLDDLAELNPEEVAKAETQANFSDDEKNKDETTDFGLVRPRILENEMQESYLDYAMSVIIARALPDVRDGLKPVHRRVLYSMHELGLNHLAKYRKSATVVGDVLGKYHPHGDLAVYETLVRLAQEFSMRVKLVDGQGNFGSMDGDRAAAMRYTEVRMTAPTEEILSDIDKNTVDFVDNYDSSRKEPKVLPAKLPNLLINGSMGIAVGMATNIPPHNLGEVCDAAFFLVDNPNCTIEDLMNFIKGPDFPTGAEIYGIEQIKNAYSTGRGGIVMRSVANIEETKRGFRIIISEIPYQVNKAELIAKIADLVKEKKLDGISDLRDESDRKEGVRIVIELRSNAYPKKILNRLFELTSLQTTFHTNMLALIDGLQPRVLTIKNILEEYIRHRKYVIRRRTQHDLDRAKERAHILEGLRIALKNIDDIVSTIRRAKNREEAHKNLKVEFKLTDVQSNAILDMRLAALSALEREKVDKEYQEKLKLIADLESILASEQKIIIIIKKELDELKNKFATPRRTKIYQQMLGKFSAEDLIPSEQVIIILTRGNYIKRMPVSAYRQQIRGGKGAIGMGTKEEDMIEHLVVANTHDDIYLFTDRGRIFHTKVYEIPSASKIAKGQAIVNILQISPEERVTAMITLSRSELQKYKHFLFATTKGLVKKTLLSLYAKVRQTGILAMKLRTDDRLRWVKVTTGNDNIFQVSAKGMSILYKETDLRSMGRTAAGVRGIYLRGDDFAVSTEVIAAGQESETDTLVVTEKGLGKRTPLTSFKIQLRGGMGIRAAAVTQRTGPIVAMRLIHGQDYDLIIASSKGQMIRTAISSIKRLQRDTQGVTVIRLNKGDKVTSVTVISKAKDDKLADVPEEPKGSEDPEKSEIDIDMPMDDDNSLGPNKENQKSEEKTESTKVKDKDNSQALIVEASVSPNLPIWAKVHNDSWKVDKPKKIPENIKVHDYKKNVKKETEIQMKLNEKGNKQNNIDKSSQGGSPTLPFKPKQDLSADLSAAASAKVEARRANGDEPNYWGGRPR